MTGWMADTKGLKNWDAQYAMGAKSKFSRDRLCSFVRHRRAGGPREDTRSGNRRTIAIGNHERDRRIAIWRAGSGYLAIALAAGRGSFDPLGTPHELGDSLKSNRRIENQRHSNARHGLPLTNEG